MRRRAKTGALGAPTDAHVRDARDRYATSQRTARVALSEVKQGDCKGAYKHVAMALANYSSGNAHVASIPLGVRSVLEPLSDRTRHALERAERAFGKKCVIQRKGR